MEKKMSVSEFASLVGTTPKTVYERIKINDKLPVNEQLNVVKERINGRETTVIATNSEQIKIYSEIYGKNTVNNGEYYEDVTVNNDNFTSYNDTNYVNSSENTENTSNFIDKLITVNENYNNRIEQKNTELITLQKELLDVKSKQLLLEDKASREGLYLQEINTLKKDNNSKNIVIRVLITVIIIMVMTILTVATYFVTVNNLKANENTTVNESNLIENWQ